MDWKAKITLKSLNWKDILKTSSDNEYDSDETVCDMDDNLMNELERKEVNCNEEYRKQHINTNSMSHPLQPIIPNITLDVNCVEQEQPKSNDNGGKGNKKLNQQENPRLCENKKANFSQTQEEVNDSEIIGTTLSENGSTQEVKRRPGRPPRCYQTFQKVLSSKILPRRNCKSIFANNRSKDEVEYESSKTDDIDITERRTLELNYTPVRFNSEIKITGGVKSNIKTVKKRGRKRRNINTSSGALKDLQEIDSALKVIEDKVERWIAETDEYPLTREQAFEMFAESQNFFKLLKEYKQNHSIKNDNKYLLKLLLKRAEIVSVLIDKTITEADRLMNLEESAESNLECELQQDSIGEPTEDYGLKSILKRTTDSEESSEPFNKHVSFSENIEYYHLTSDCSLDTNNESQELNSNRKWGNVIDHSNEKKNKFLKRDTHEEMTVNTKEIEIQKCNIKERTGMNNFGNRLTLGEEISGDCVPGKNYAPRSDNVTKETAFEKNIKKTETISKDQCQPKQIEHLNNLHVQESNTIITEREVIVDKNKPSLELQSRNLVKDSTYNSEDLSTRQVLMDKDDTIQSEGSTGDENSFGFSKYEVSQVRMDSQNQSDELAWTKITIMSIKHIAVRDNDEHLGTSDASFSLEDFNW